MESTTGVKRLNRPKNLFAIYFDDNKCPYCGNNMRLDSMRVGNEQTNIRYICDKCGLILPIKHNEENPNNILPLSDNSIFLFLSSFGEDIRIKRCSY